LLYFDLCYENTISATTRAHVINVTHTTCLQPGKHHSTHRSLRQARRSLFLETVSLQLPGISLKKNYQVLTGSVYREPAELKILFYFGLCYEKISYRKSACTTDSVSHLGRRTFYIPIFYKFFSVGYPFAYVVSL
jgi:hypothetical protein